MITTHAVAERHIVRRYTCRTHIYYTKGLRDSDCPSGAFVSIHQEPLDQAVWTHITRILTDRSLLQDTYNQFLAKEAKSEELHADRLTAIQEEIQQAEKRRRRAQRLALEAEDDELATDYNAEAQEAAKKLRGLEAERDKLITLHSAQASHTQFFADLVARKNDATARLLQMTTQERRNLLDELGVRVHVYRQEHDPWWAIEAEVQRIAAYFNSLPGHNRGKKPAGSALDTGSSDSSSTSNYQNCGKPCNSSNSGPWPVAT